MRVGIVGGCSVDHVVRVPEGARFDLPGGPGLFASLGAKLALGEAGEVRFGGTVPTDACGLDLAFAAADIDLSWARRDGAAARLWILDSREGRRVLHTAPSASELSVDPDSNATASEPPPLDGFGTGLDGLLLCAPGGPPEYPIDAATVVAADPDQNAISRSGWDYLHALATRVQILLPSRIQLRQLAARDGVDDDAVAVALSIRRRTGMHVVARLDVDGAVVAGEDAVPRPVPAADATVADTTGAGDSHAGAFLAAYLQTRDLLAATHVAAQTVTHALAGWGADGLLHALAASED